MAQLAKLSQTSMLLQMQMQGLRPLAMSAGSQLQPRQLINNLPMDPAGPTPISLQTDAFGTIMTL